MIESKIEGADQVLAKLKELSVDVRKKSGRFALRKAALVVEAAAKENASKIKDPDTAKSIASNIAIRWNGRLNKQTGDLGFRVGVLKGAVLPKRGEKVEVSAGAATPEWRLVEFGTEKMRARPFMRPALESNINNATNTFMEELNKSVDRAIKRKN